MILSIAAIGGCGGGDGLPREAVSGAVTLDGAPLPRGTITFLPDDPDMPDPTSGGAPILDGRYEIDAARGLVPGRYKVAISSPSVEMTDDAAPGSAANLPKELIPARYNRDTTLTAPVEARGDNEFDYELTTD